MESELMNTFTNEQLGMCDKDTLIKYINDIKEQQKPTLLLHSVIKSDMVSVCPLDRFLNEKCALKDDNKLNNGRTLAPTGFEDIYYEYKQFRKDEGLDYGVGDKAEIRELFILAQKQTKYGLDIGQRKNDLRKNGSLRQPYLNFALIDPQN